MLDELDQRAVASDIEAKAVDAIHNNVDEESEINPSRRSIDDVSVWKDNIRYYIDVKTHYLQENGFSMPNLTSIERIKKVFSDGDEILYVFIDYSRGNNVVEIENVDVLPVHKIDWDSLRIGALGKGQLQIKDNSLQLTISDMSKIEWHQELKKQAIIFCKDQAEVFLSKRVKGWQDWKI